MKPKSTRVMSSPCPHCRRVHDAASNWRGQTPRLGDVTVCIDCGGVALFGLGLAREPIPEPLLSEVLAEPEIQRMQWAVRKLRRPLWRGI